MVLPNTHPPRVQLNHDNQLLSFGNAIVIVVSVAHGANAKCRGFLLLKITGFSFDLFSLVKGTHHNTISLAGDAYRYTIQPVFQNIKEEFQCHLRHREPKILYQMFYYIMLPGRKFETPRVYKTVYAHDLPYQSHGEFQADYITVEHNTGLKLHVKKLQQFVISHGRHPPFI